LTTFIIRRLLHAIIVVIIISLLTFSAMHYLPGDPILIFISQNEFTTFTKEQLDILRHEIGLDKSLPSQYINWVSNLFHGDFGKSIIYNDKVSTLIAERLPVTLYFGLVAFVFSSLTGILLGTIAAIRQGKWADALVTALANLGITAPVFWFGILMIWLFGLQFHWLPIQGYTSPLKDFGLSIRHLIMPVICLSVLTVASGARQTRSCMLEVIRQDYIRTAWSKGLTEKNVILKHALKNGLVPVITLLGISVANIFGGSVLVETVFNIPGMGRLLVNAVFAQDYPVVQGVILITSMVVVLTNLLVDISYGWLDPRIRFA
jgi:peptide/nickel transport system permease protein